MTSRLFCWRVRLRGGSNKEVKEQPPLCHMDIVVTVRVTIEVETSAEVVVAVIVAVEVEKIVVAVVAAMEVVSTELTPDFDGNKNEPAANDNIATTAIPRISLRSCMLQPY